MIRSTLSRLLPRSLARALGLLPSGPTRFIMCDWNATTHPTPKWEGGSPLFFFLYREGILSESPPPPQITPTPNWPPLVVPMDTHLLPNQEKDAP